MTAAAAADDAPEVSVRVTSPLLQLFESQRGAAALEQVISSLGLTVTIAYLKNRSNFISLRCLQRIADALSRESGDPLFAQKAGAMTIAPQSLGFVYYMLRAFGSPRQTYEKTVALAPAYNRVGSFRIERLSQDLLELSYRSTVPETSRVICEFRMAQFAAVPTIWGLPAAQVVESHCQVSGADRCQYSLRWKPHRPAPLAAIALTGIGALGALAVLRTVDQVPGWMGAAVLLAALTSLGLWLATRAELRRKEEYLASTNEGLMSSFLELQVRYGELHQAKLELEDRVSARTQELSEANARLAASLEHQRAVDRMKTEFFDNVSHELRTPLTLILLSLEALRARPAELEQDGSEYLDGIERSASRLLRLINDLLDLAKLEAGKLRLRYEPVELHGFIKGALLPFKVMARHKQIALTLRGGPTPLLQADSEKLEAVFQNLLSNALKFTPEGGRVEVTVAEEGEEVVLTIADTGIGIAAADLPMLFDRFAQADASGKRRFGGTGIGLSLVKEVVELHGGRIDVHSALGAGSTFTVRLPKGHAHVREELRDRRIADLPVPIDRRGFDLPAPPPPAAAVALPSPGSAAAPPAPAPHDGRPRVLVIEDDPQLRRFLREALAARFEVLEAEDGEAGLELCRSRRPDVVVSDVMMPRLSGMELIGRLRASPETAELPVILLTARRHAEAAAEGLDAGATDYVSKPFSPRELIARVDTQLRLREAARRMAQSERLATLGLVTAGFAHEVRNPLNGLLNLLPPLRGTLESGEKSQSLELVSVVEECGRRVKALAESLLAFSRPSANPDEPVDVAQTVEDALHALGARVAPPVDVRRTLHPGVLVAGDRSGLGQVWVNLIDNALQAIPRDGWIEVSVRQEGAQALITVHDSGPGILAENLGRIFDPFFTTRAAGAGTGLGLALCRRIVLEHGGQIEAHSPPGGGAVFTVRLPAFAPRRDADPDRPRSGPPPAWGQP